MGVGQSTIHIVIHTGTGPTGYEVTFRYYDPTATNVWIKGEWYFSDDANTSANPPTSAGYLPTQWKPGYFPIAYPNATGANWPVNDMVLDAATGIWSFTTPLPSGVSTYAFYKNCLNPLPSLAGCTGFFDPANPPCCSTTPLRSAHTAFRARAATLHQPGDPRWTNPELKALLGLQMGIGLYDPILPVRVDIKTK